jgi:uncharacterized protein (DUF885 family)
MLHRRALLASAAAAGLAPLTGCATGAGATDGDAAVQLRAALDRAFAEQLRLQPENATGLGLDTGENAALKSRLSGSSPADRTALNAARKRWLADVRRVDRARLSGMAAVDHDTVVALWSLVSEAQDRFPYADMSYPAPYVVSQLTGSYQSVPDFLDSQHAIATAADAEAYLARLDAFAGNVEQETARFRRDTAAGITPPDFILDLTLTQLRAFRSQPAAKSTLVQSLARRTREKGIAGDWERRAAAIYDGRLSRALDAQIAAVEQVRRGAVHDAGVWRLPNGSELYRYATRIQTTTNLTPDQIHDLGLQQCAEISARIDAILRTQGLTQGSVGQRVNALGGDPRRLYPNTEPGKAQLLNDLREQMRVLRTKLPAVFATLPKAPVEVRRVPPEIEAGAPLGYYQSPTLDGSRPGAYYINLRNTAEWPRFTLPTLTYHEAEPGHHLQIALQQEAEALPLIRRNMLFPAFAEGWGLYAEQLADELGMYQGDPFGQVGYLQSLLFRAARLVVDTGLHHKRWSREQAIKWMVATTGDQESSIASEVERYCVWPGQACSYKVGHTEIVRLREAAKAKLGSRFDIRSFHDAVLLSGGMPLTVLARVVDDWTAAQA